MQYRHNFSLIVYRAIRVHIINNKFNLQVFERIQSVLILLCNIAFIFSVPINEYQWRFAAFDMKKYKIIAYFIISIIGYAFSFKLDQTAIGKWHSASRACIFFFQPFIQTLKVKNMSKNRENKEIHLQTVY